jgi:hypothetical protein
MRAYIYFAATIIVAVLSYDLFTRTAMDGRPLNPELAYEALVTKLQQTEGGRQRLILSETTLMQRKNELIFLGRGRVRSANRGNYDVPIIESSEFQYIAVIRRNCGEWHSDCYRASELEITGTKLGIPMI